MTGQGGLEHGSGTPHPGLNFDCAWFTVKLAGSAFDAGVTIDQHCYLFAGGKDALGTDNRTHPAIGAQFRRIKQGVGSGDGFHLFDPIFPNQITVR